jgi:hypothetical protein
MKTGNAGRARFPSSINACALLLLLPHCIHANPLQYKELNRDSIPAYSNIAILTAGKPINTDRLYCDSLVGNGKKAFKGSGESKRSLFMCKDQIVNRFTFVGYQDGSINLLYKPEGSKREVFSKARIRSEDLEKVFAIDENEEAEGARPQRTNFYAGSGGGIGSKVAGLGVGALTRYKYFEGSLGFSGGPTFSATIGLAYDYVPNSFGAFASTGWIYLNDRELFGKKLMNTAEIGGLYNFKSVVVEVGMTLYSKGLGVPSALLIPIPSLTLYFGDFGTF